MAPASCPTRASRRTAYRPHAPHTMVKNHALRVRLALIFACITDRSPVGRHETGDGGLILKHAGKLGFEGVVSKTIDAPYAPGNRGLWRKAKWLNRQEFVVVGRSDPEGSRPHLGALLLGYYTDDGKLIYAGRVGTGMPVKVLADLRRRLEPLARKTSPLNVLPPRKTRFGSPLVLSRTRLIRGSGQGSINQRQSGVDVHRTFQIATVDVVGGGNRPLEWASRLSGQTTNRTPRLSRLKVPGMASVTDARELPTRPSERAPRRSLETPASAQNPRVLVRARRARRRRGPLRDRILTTRALRAVRSCGLSAVARSRSR